MLSLPEETILYGSPESEFVVTSHRLRVDSKSWGQAHVISIMLEELRSSELKYTSHPLFFLFAFITLILGVVGTLIINPRGNGIVNLLKFLPLCSGGMLAIGVVFFYFITRRITLVFASAGSSIELDAMRLGMERSKELIDTIESAKDYRYLQIGVIKAEVLPE